MEQQVVCYKTRDKTGGLEFEDRRRNESDSSLPESLTLVAGGVPGRTYWYFDWGKWMMWETKTLGKLLCSSLGLWAEKEEILYQVVCYKVEDNSEGLEFQYSRVKVTWFSGYYVSHLSHFFNLNTLHNFNYFYLHIQYIIQLEQSSYVTLCKHQFIYKLINKYKSHKKNHIIPDRKTICQTILRENDKKKRSQKNRLHALFVWTGYWYSHFGCQ